MMKTALATAAAVLATPFAADPVGTKRPYLDFADDRENPKRIIEPYVGRSANPLIALLGGSDLPPHVENAAVALGYAPERVIYSVTDAGGLGEVDEDGFRVVNEGEFPEDSETWAAFWDVDGNVADENGSLHARNLTLVRLI